MLNVYVPIYNSLFCAEYHIKTLRAFLKDDFQLIIIDNNAGRHPESSESLKLLCDREGVLLDNSPDEELLKFQSFIEEGKLGISPKLGYTLNKIWKHARDSGVEHFGFLDQDCFLFRPTSVVDLLQDLPAYGKVVPTHADPIHYLPDGKILKWNLHVITNFYRTSWLKEAEDDNRPPNFMPGWCAGLYFPPDVAKSLRTELDTGGLNWLTLWRHEDPTRYALPEDRYLYFDDTSLLDPDGAHPTKTLYEIVDDRWVHMMHGTAGSDSSEYTHPKSAYMKGFLDSMLLYHQSTEMKPTAHRSMWDPRDKKDVS